MTLSTSPSSSSLSLPSSELLPPAELPTPNAEEVARFQSLYSARFSVDLDEEEAHDQARRLVQFVFLMQHALPHLQELQAKQQQTEQEAETIK